MNPHQKNKVDVKSLSPEEQRLFRLYGKLPSKSDHFAKHLKERKYFDSGDYALSKAGKADSVDTGAVGSEHPVPENIPHLSSPVGAHAPAGIIQQQQQQQHQQQQQQQQQLKEQPLGQAPMLKHPHSGVAGGHPPLAGSPVKEASFLNRETSAGSTTASADENAQAST